MLCQQPLQWTEGPLNTQLSQGHQTAVSGKIPRRLFLSAQSPAQGSSARASWSAPARFSLAAAVQELHELDNLRQALSRPPKTQFTLRNPARLAAQSQHSIAVRDLGGDLSLDAYMRLPVEQYSELDPNVLKNIGPQLFALKVPRVHLFQIWIEPLVQATVNLQHDPEMVLIQSTNCRIRGSELVENLHLDDRFCIAFTTQLHWSSSSPGSSPNHASSTNEDSQPSSSSFMMQDNSAVQQQAAHAHRVAVQQTAQTSTIHADLSLEVWSEVIGPFDLLPRGMLEGTGSAVISSLVKGLLPVFMRRLGQDYEHWATDEAYRQRRSAG